MLIKVALSNIHTGRTNQIIVDTDSDDKAV